jgi:sugar (pentulose or hexulose) kinase
MNKALKIAMIEKDITYADVARQLGNVKPGTVKVVANGFAKTPRIRKALADAVGKTIEELWPKEDAAINEQ